MSNDPQRSPADDAHAAAVLREAPVAFLGLVDDGPYVVPMNFAYEDPSDRGGGQGPGRGRIVFHSGAGRKSDALAKDPRVCLVVTVDTTLERGSSPCDDGFAYTSALVQGRAMLLETREDREAALRTIVAKYDPAAALLPFDEDDFERTLVYAIAIETLSYKERPRSPEE
jgi:nitroimidazol reductase NimA-like FMN-containing flavoprotein (pyridoxamine 5'-phosphate oxidase superfamily)